MTLYMCNMVDRMNVQPHCRIRALRSTTKDPSIANVQRPLIVHDGVPRTIAGHVMLQSLWIVYVDAHCVAVHRILWDWANCRIRMHACTYVHVGCSGRGPRNN